MLTSSSFANCSNTAVFNWFNAAVSLGSKARPCSTAFAVSRLDFRRAAYTAPPPAAPSRPMPPSKIAAPTAADPFESPDDEPPPATCCAVVINDEAAPAQSCCRKCDTTAVSTCLNDLAVNASL